MREDAAAIRAGSQNYSLAQWVGSGNPFGKDTNSIAAASAAVLFNPQTPSGYGLALGSPALDNGLRLPEVPDDYQMVPRPVEPNYDIGALEGPN